MSEPEVDSLMQGQEDENGSVNYEGRVSKQTRLTISLRKRKKNPKNLIDAMDHLIHGTASCIAN